MRREKVAVLTAGTLTDQEMMGAQPEAAYLMSLAELPVPGQWLCRVGFVPSPAALCRCLHRSVC